MSIVARKVTTAATMVCGGRSVLFLLVLAITASHSSAFSSHVHPLTQYSGTTTHHVFHPRGFASPKEQKTRATTTTTCLSAASTATFGVTVATLYKTYPLVANFLTCSIKAGLSDSLAQWRDVCTTKFSYKRNISMMLYSGTVLGILVDIMYNRIFPIMFGTTNNASRIVRMTLFDGFINAPLLWLPPAYLVQALLYGYPKRQALQKYVKDVRDNGLLLKYWSLWVPLTFINFGLVPPHFRVAFMAMISFFWMIILSLVANKKEPEKIIKELENCPVEPEPILLNPRALD